MKINLERRRSVVKIGNEYATKTPFFIYKQQLGFTIRRGTHFYMEWFLYF